MLNLSVTSEDLVVLNGGGSQTVNGQLFPLEGSGHQSHHPVWKDKDGVEYISLDGHTFVKLSTQNFSSSRRETVAR